MNHSHTIVLSAAGIALVLAAGCGGTSDSKAGPEADKKAYEEAGVTLKRAIGLISAYLPHLGPPDTKDKYAPQRRPDHERANQAAANEIRHAANAARQVLQRTGATATKDLQAALVSVAVACAEAQDPPAFEKCGASVRALDETLQKAEAASAAAGAAAKFPRIGPEAITDEAKAAMGPFLKVRGPGPGDLAYVAKRADSSVSVEELISACQAAMGESDDVARAYEKAEEPLRLIAVTRKMSLDSQCNALNAADAARKDLENCRKKPKDSECSIICGKAKTIIDTGVPAAAFEPISKDYTEICEKK